MWRPIATLGLVMAMGLAFGGTADAAKTKVPRLKVTSAQIAPRATIADEQVANTFGCKGGNISPEIKWSGAPAGTKSFAVSIYDPDAPTGSGFWHWVVYNIPATTTELPKNAGDQKANLMPAGAIQSRTDFGVSGYNGPCPPPGDKPHRYHISVFAVDVPKLDGDQNTPAAVVGFQLHFHTIAKGVLTGKYGREK
ncbi:MAG TPA: YbhB/YbcL family Raf kinase inhibitor-like protein [Stellaceae bacterium]